MKHRESLAAWAFAAPTCCFVAARSALRASAFFSASPILASAFARRSASGSTCCFTYDSVAQPEESSATSPATAPSVVLMSILP